jgi:hypothetical protein
VRLELRLPSADAAERLADLARDVPASDANRRLALPAVPEAEPAVMEPCTPAAARFAARSCVAAEAQMEEEDAPQ